MSKLEVCFYLESADPSDISDHLCSQSLSSVPQIGSTVLLKEQGWDFKKRKATPYKVDGQYLVKDVHHVIRNKPYLITEGEDAGLPGWETKERVEVMLVEIENYVR
jgi:hypothetical protein